MEQEAKKQLAKLLGQLLADSYVLYVKTQHFHWNIRDPRFYSLHGMFQDQYEDLAKAVDDIAEQIRQVGSFAPGSMADFLKLATLKEDGGLLSGDEMIKQLARDNWTLVDQLRKMIAESQKLGDEGTADLLIERLRSHNKAAWMLDSHFTS